MPTQQLVEFLVPCLLIALGAMGCQVAPAPPFRQNMRILFQGDSITDGNRGRSDDPNHILGHGYVFLIAAREGFDLPHLRLEFVNRGVSGDTVADLERRWDTDVLDLKPDMLSILIGVNDAASAVDGNAPASADDGFEATYDRLLTRTVEKLPGVRLVLCEPFILPVGRVKARWDAWQAQVQPRQAIVARLARKHNATLVRFQQAFDAACTRAPAEYWIWDGIHPTYRGHQIMANEWLRAVSLTGGASRG